MKKTKATKLKIGMRLSVWDWNAGDGEVIADIQPWNRPGMKYQGFTLTMKNGDIHRVLETDKFTVLSCH